MPLSFGQCVAFLVMNVFRRAAVLRARHVRGLRWSRAGGAGHHQSHLHPDVVSWRACSSDGSVAGRICARLAPLWPAHHLLQLSRAELEPEHLWARRQPTVAALLGATVLFFALAMRKLSGSGIRLFGGTRAGSGQSACGARSTPACSRCLTGPADRGRRRRQLRRTPPPRTAATSNARRNRSRMLPVPLRRSAWPRPTSR
jgi:hypothetical protein